MRYVLARHTFNLNFLSTVVLQGERRKPDRDRRRERTGQVFAVLTNFCLISTSVNSKANLGSFLHPMLDYWIGLTDVEEEGEFLWQHSNLTPKYLNWHVQDGQPDDYDHGGHGGEDCVQLVNLHLFLLALF